MMTTGGNLKHFTDKELFDKIETEIHELIGARVMLEQAEHRIPFYQKELVKRYFREEVIEHFQEDHGEFLWDILYSSLQTLRINIVDKKEDVPL